MAKGLQFEGLSAYADQLKKLGDHKAVAAVMKPTLYVGAGIYADALRSAAQAHVDTGALVGSITLSDMKEADGYYTNLGFAGYDDKGTPNALKAAVIESGNSTHPKHPFIRPAMKAAKPKAEAAMNAKMAEILNNMMEV